MTARYLTTDKQAIAILRSAHYKDERGKVLIDVALKASETTSFIKNQTYPRPFHLRPEMRLSPIFTFIAIIVSLRCTLATEMQVTNNLISLSQGDPMKVLTMEDEGLVAALRPCGMANQKAKWIKEGLHALLYDPSYTTSVLGKMSLQAVREHLMKIKGLGPKAVDCLLLLGYERPVFPVDTNVFKVVSNFFPDILPDSQLPSFNNPHHVRSVKVFLENQFEENVALYQVLHTYLLLFQKHRMTL